MEKQQKHMDSENSKNLTKCLGIFIIKSLYDQLSEMHKTQCAINDCDPFPNINHPKIYTNIVERHMNKMYGSLTRRNSSESNDDYILRSFDKFKQYSDHSELCMIYFMYNAMCLFYHFVKIRYCEDYSSFMIYCHDIISTMVLEQLMPLMEKSLCHVCEPNPTPAVENDNPNTACLVLKPPNLPPHLFDAST